MSTKDVYVIPESLWRRRFECTGFNDHAPRFIEISQLVTALNFKLQDVPDGDYVRYIVQGC